MDNLHILRKNLHFLNLRQLQVLIRLFILCSIFIVIVIFARKLNFHLPAFARPISVNTTNLNAGSANISFYTKEESRNCLFLVSLWYPSIKYQCEDRLTNTHYISFGNLIHNAYYQLYIFQGIYLHRQQIDMIGNYLDSHSYIPQSLPAIKTISNDLLSSHITLTGNAVDRSGNLQKSTVVVAFGSENEAYSAITNEEGKFSLVMPADWQDKEITLKAISKNGRGEMFLPVGIVQDRKLKLVVLPYE